jgi:site-specific recombinase XerD
MFKGTAGNWSEKALNNTELLTLFTFLKEKSARQDVAASGLRDLHLVATMMFSGLRISQVCGLTIADVEVKDGEYVALHTVRQKAHDENMVCKVIPRSVPIPGCDTFGCIHTAYTSSRIATHTNPDEPFYISSRGNALLTGTVRANFSDWSQRLGFHVHPHRLRHTCGTIVALNVGIAQAALMLDHSDIRTTQRYIADVRPDSSAETIYQAFSMEAAG